MLRYLIITALALLAVYGAREAWPLVAGPTLEVESPANYEAFPGGIVSIQGTAARTATLTLNDGPLLHEESGRFSAIRTLPQGGSILTLVATDRFGRRVSVTRQIFIP